MRQVFVFQNKSFNTYRRQTTHTHTQQTPYKPTRAFLSLSLFSNILRHWTQFFVKCCFKLLGDLLQSQKLQSLSLAHSKMLTNINRGKYIIHKQLSLSLAHSKMLTYINRGKYIIHKQLDQFLSVLRDDGITLRHKYGSGEVSTERVNCFDDGLLR